MFQFRAFPSYGYLIHRTITEYCSVVLPHSEISGSRLICSSPKLFAACHVLHRLLMPRHSPCALISLTFVRENFTPLRPSCAGRPLRSVSSSCPFQTRLRWALKREKWCSIFLVLLNYAGSTRSFSRNCFYPLFISKVFHNCFLESISAFTLINSLCCLAFFLLYSVFKVHLKLTPHGGE